MRILIIEDNKKVSNSIEYRLEREGFAVDCISSVSDGQNRLLTSEDEYDLLILNLISSEIDKLAICRNIRKEGIHLPIIMLIVGDDVEDRVAALNSGADDCIAKPFSFKEFFARIRAILRRPKKTLLPELKAGELTMDTANKKVYRSGDEIKLSLKEFSLLEYLMRNPNRVLSREQIIEHVWDFAFDSFSNVVDAQIKNLRKKIDNGYHKKILETIRGLGYRLKG
jgi:DNA-binding response OmpR family regulator